MPRMSIVFRRNDFCHDPSLPLQYMSILMLDNIKYKKEMIMTLKNNRTIVVLILSYYFLHACAEINSD